MESGKKSFDSFRNLVIILVVLCHTVIHSMSFHWYVVSGQFNYTKNRVFHAIFMPVFIEFSRCIGTYSRAKFELIKNIYHQIVSGGGIPIIPFENLEKHFIPSEYSILFCIGYSHMNQVRKKYMDEALVRGFSIAGYQHPTALIQADKIGYGNIFMENVIIGQGVEIGNGNIFWPAAHIAHHTFIGNYNFFTISVAVAGNIQIHDFCVFGANSTVKNGVEIKDGTLVGAGAYISYSTEEWGVYTPPRTYKLEGKSSLDFKL